MVKNPPGDFYNPDPQVEVEEAEAAAPDAASVDPALGAADKAYEEEDAGPYRNPNVDERGMGRPTNPLEMRDTGYAWQPNFYPGSREPHVLGQTRGVGKYQGAPIFNQTAGAFPLDVIASRSSYLAKERKENMAAAAKLADPNTELEDIKRAEYRDKTHAYQYDELAKERRAVIDLYQGNTKEAMAALNNPNTIVGRQHKQLVDSLNTITRLVNQNTEKAQEVVTGMESGGKQWDQKLYDESQDILHGLSTGGDGRELAKQHRNYASMINLRTYFKDTGLQGMLQQSGNTIETLGKVQNKGGKWFMDKDVTEFTPEQQIDAVVDGLPPMYHMQMGRDKLKEFVRGYVNEKRLKEPIVKNFDSGGGGSDKPKSKRDGWVDGGWQQNGIRVTVQDQGKPTKNAVIKSGRPVQYKGQEEFALDIRREKDGEYVDLGPVALRNSNGVKQYMIPQEIVRRNGRWFISGPLYAYGKQQAESATGAEGEDPYEPGAEKTSGAEPSQDQKFKELKPKLFPFEENLSWANDYGINPDEIIRMHKGGKTVRFDTDSGSQTVSSGSEAAPAPGAKKAPDGNWYVPDPARKGKYLMVESPAAAAPRQAPATTVTAQKEETKTIPTVKPITTVEPVMTKAAVVDTIKTQAPAKPAAVAAAAQESPRASAALDFFKGGRIVNSDMGGKKVYFITQPGGMQTPLSTYFEDEESAKLVLDAFNRGEIYEQHLSKFRSVKDQYAKVRREKGE